MGLFRGARMLTNMAESEVECFRGVPEVIWHTTTCMVVIWHTTTVRVKGGMSLRNGMWHGFWNDIIMRNVIYAE